MFGFLWNATRGYRLAPWKSPYLRWRIETYQGTPAEEITSRDFWNFVWGRRAEFVRFLRWAQDNRRHTH
jgi:hypothetical protein